MDGEVFQAVNRFVRRMNIHSVYNAQRFILEAALPRMTNETQAEDLASLYRRAFAEYGTQALWNKRVLDSPTPDDALVIARALRIEGDRQARQLAEQIEQACRAAH